MSKKISTIFLSLFLVGILSISCSNKDKTGSGNSTVDNSKGVEQYNGNTYVSTKITINSQEGYVWVSIKDAKVSFEPGKDNITPPPFNELNYFSVTGSGTDYSFSNDEFAGTLKFSSDASTVTFNFTKNVNDPTGETLNKNIACSKK